MFEDCSWFKGGGPEDMVLGPNIAHPDQKIVEESLRIQKEKGLPPWTMKVRVEDGPVLTARLIDRKEEKPFFETWRTDEGGQDFGCYEDHRKVWANGGNAISGLGSGGKDDPSMRIFQVGPVIEEKIDLKKE